MNRKTLLRAYYKGLTALYDLKLTRAMMAGGAALSLGAIVISGAIGGDKSEPGPAPQIAAIAPNAIHDAIFANMTSRAISGKAMTVTLRPGDSLGPLLQKNGVGAQTAYKVTQAFSTVFKPRNVRAGQNISLYFDEAQNPGLVGISFKPNFERAIHVNRTGSGDYAARDVAITFPKELVQVSGTIANSLYLDAAKMGVPDKVTVQFSQIYEHSVDFQRDIQPGDAFTMAFELYRDAKGNPLKAGDLLYTSFSPRGKTSDFYLYTNKAGGENYYDAKGKGAKRKLMRTPINGARLSSGFGRRRHPISGYRKNHNGVDFAARSGTPIMAAGVGTIERASRWSTFGNYVRIRHSDGYKTAYAHMKGFARGIKKGARVRQGQTIGYVGTTGASTGPHLHYEVHKGGRKINPRSLSTLSGKPLPKAERAAFNLRRAEIDALRKDAPPALIIEVATEAAPQIASVMSAPGQQ
ncbi:MAG: M23 family metallopeptidase [Robiginitomaculum sp.]